MNRNGSALLVIDVQTGMFGTPALHDASGLLSRLSLAIGRARTAEVPVIFVRHDGGPGDPLEPGTPGWEIHSWVAPRPEETIVDKTTPDSFHGTDLAAVLARHDVGRLLICGAQTEYCVDTTCRRATSLGFEVVLLEDAHSTFDNGVLAAEQIIRHHNLTLGRGFAQRLRTAEVLFR